MQSSPQSDPTLPTRSFTDSDRARPVTTDEMCAVKRLLDATEGRYHGWPLKPALEPHEIQACRVLLDRLAREHRDD